MSECLEKPDVKPLAVNVSKVLRSLGDHCAREYSTNAGEDLLSVRTCPRSIISEEWKDLIRRKVIPKGLLMKEFAIGWRDSTIAVLHGKPSRYNAGCRCRLCKLAIAEYQKKYHRDRKALLSAEMVEKFKAGTLEVIAQDSVR